MAIETREGSQFDHIAHSTKAFSNQRGEPNILEWVAQKTNTYFAKVNKDGTSQTCPNCGAHTGKKTLDIRVHSCSECGYTTTRDVAAAQEIRNRGVSALGHSVLKNVCGLDATGSIGHITLVGTVRSRKLAS